MFGRRSRGYQVYTRVFDRVVRADNIPDLLGALSCEHKVAFDEACAVFDAGLLGWKTDLHIICSDSSQRIVERLSRDAREDTIVSLLIDHSGSMRGQRLLFAAATAEVLTDMLCCLGIKVEVLGFTTKSWHGGMPRRLWKMAWRRRNPGRLCELLHVVYRSADSTPPGVPWSIHNMLRADLPKENVDGEAIEWAMDRLRARPEARKILLVLTDGAPVDDATFLANGPHFLPDHLRKVVSDSEVQGDIVIGAVDICGGHAVSFYRNYEKVDAVRELGIKSLALLERLVECSSSKPAPE